MEIKNNKLIVVLGMHRSGTSAITRGLQVMGVELGNRMMPPVKGDNPKGYWEDIELNALNIEMLHAIGNDWCHLAAIDSNDINILRNQGYFLRAVDLLRHKVINASPFGFKDPRVAKLLPFWKEVFSHCRFDVSYVIVVRHPLSVVKSLDKRGGIEAEQSYLLWLGHVIMSLTGSVDDKRVLVDYDRLMQSPDYELNRIAKHLDLELDTTELQSYKTGFLDQGLRHTIYDLNDLLLDDSCPPIVYEIYAALFDVASEKTKLDDLELLNRIARWSDEFERLKSPLKLVDRLLIQKGVVASQTVAERDGQIATLSQAIAERDGQLATLNQAIAERESQMAELRAEIVSREEWALKLDQHLKIAQAQYTQMASSTSWRISLPLREAKRFLIFSPQQQAKRYARGSLRLARRLYQTLPLSCETKEAHRSALVNYLPRVLLVSGCNPAAIPKSVMSVTEQAVPEQIATLPSADGTWEWSDYNAVKSSISQIKARKLSEVSPSPLELIDIGNESFVSAASRVKLPDLIAEPDVSIILPVFNNLKLTLECLLSIAAHTASGVSYEVIIADDASTDETAQVIGSIPHLRVIRNESNLGFLRNCNNALKHVQGSYVVYLNNDVQITSGWLNALLGTFDSHPNVGAVGPRFVYPSGHLQEAGAAFRQDGTADMIGLNGDPSQARFSYTRRVDYVSGACLMLPTSLAKQLGGFSEDFLPCYCEDSDLCLMVQEAGYYVYYNPAATIVHHLSKTTDAIDASFKLRCIAKNLVTLQQKWLNRLEYSVVPKVIAFYLPQFHPIPENDKWWGSGFTEWANVTKAQPNFVGHYQPRIPTDLGYYDLRLPEIMEQQAELADRYGVGGFCFYYYWFDGKRLLDRPIEQMLETGKPDFPFCLCWANENWTRRWDGQDQEILIAQSHSSDDDEAGIMDLIRYFRDARYIRIDGRPLILVYRVTLFPNFLETAALWRTVCLKQGIGEIYIAMVESMEMVHANKHPKEYGCDAAVEFPPHEFAEQKAPTGEIINPDFAGIVADYRDLAVCYATREVPAYTRFMSVIPGWDNTARRQNNSFCFEHATPGAFQAWLEETIEQTRIQQYGDERLIFVNAWNEWAEGAYLEPDRRFGHSYLEAVKNALEAARLLRKDKYGLGD